MTRPPVLQLTWDGLDAAVHLIAAQCLRDRVGVHGVDRGGQVLAWAIADRLGMEVMRQPGAGMLQLHGVVASHPWMLWGDAQVWAWVDASPQQNITSVMKVTPGTTVLMPWQDAVASTRPFVPGFDD